MSGMLPSGNPDILVVGGGPAGATAARLLSSWNWSVLLVHRPSDRPALAESLPPSTKKLLAFLGQAETVGSAGFYPNHGNVACWGGSLRETWTEEPGFHVSRRSFDAMLRQSARGAGVTIVDAVVRRVDLTAEPLIDFVTTIGEWHTVQPRFVLDCSGRASVVGRRGDFGRQEAPYRTLALAAEWESSDWPDAERTRTFVESFDEGWAWSVPLSDVRRQITVMIDPHRAGEEPLASREAALQHIYANALGRAPHLRARISQARQLARPWGSNASIFRSDTPCAPGVLLVGDAASFIEPLSSAGVKKAMMSAWRAAVIANTSLGKPDMTRHALAYYTDRERHVYDECDRIAREFFQEAAAFHRTPFWAVRAGASDAREDDTDGLVRRAHARLRDGQKIRLRPAAALRFGSAPDIEGREVVLRDAVLVPGSDTPLLFAAGVNLPALVRIAAEIDDVPAIFSAYHAHVGPAPVDSLVTGLSVLVAHQALIIEDSRR